MSEESKLSFQRPTEESLKSLIRWPEGTVGYYSELKLLKQIKELCDEHGYGRVPQLSEQVCDIWRNPENVDKYLKQQKEHNDFMEECRKEIED